MSTRLRVAVRRNRLLVDADDLAGLFRARARHYIERADNLVLASLDPSSPVYAEDGDPVPIMDEALACRMVAEELEQRADELDRI